jgi:hypothetical protein
MTRAACQAPATEYPVGKSLSKIFIIAAAEAFALIYAAVILMAAIAPAPSDIVDKPYVGPTKIIRR